MKFGKENKSNASPSEQELMNMGASADSSSPEVTKRLAKEETAVSRERLKKSEMDAQTSHNEAKAAVNETAAFALRRNPKFFATMFEVIGVVVLMVCCVGLWGSMKRAFVIGFNKTIENAKEEAEKKAYEDAFEYFEKEYHVSNLVSITLGNLRDEKKLEVFEVSTTSFQASDDNRVWLLISGNCTYTVDLRAAEFIVDNAHRRVLVRLPQPVPGNIDIDYSDIEQYEDKEDNFVKIIQNFSDNAAEKGEEIAQRMVARASEEMEIYVVNNSEYFQQASESAVSFVENAVKAVNPDVPDLEVEVSFFN